MFFLIYIPTKKTVLIFTQQVWTKCLPWSGIVLGRGEDTVIKRQGFCPQVPRGRDRHNEIITNTNVITFTIQTSSIQAKARYA